MRTEMSRFLAKIVFSSLVAASGILLVGCKRITSADISGVYTRSQNGVFDTVILASNGTFKQTITFTNGGQWTVSGSWKFYAQESVEFDQFYEVFEIKSDPYKVYAGAVIPPRLGANEYLEVQEGKLLKNSAEPIWFKHSTP